MKSSPRGFVPLLFQPATIVWLVIGLATAVASPVDEVARPVSLPPGDVSAASGDDRRPADAPRIAVLKAPLPGSNEQFVELLEQSLRDEGFAITTLSAMDVCDERVLTSDQFFLLLIPNCQAYPADGVDVLAAYAGQGGHICFLGGPFLDSMVWHHDGKWLDQQAIDQIKRQATVEHYPLGTSLPDPDDWDRHGNRLSTPAQWGTVPEGPAGERCFHFWTANFTGWEGNLSPVIDDLFGPEHDLFCFQAKGAESTNQLAVEIQETDGSRWMAVVELETHWQPFRLSPSDFHYWPDSAPGTQRGGASDRLHPPDARRINFQLAKSHTNLLSDGEQEFWIADIGTCRNPVGDLEYTDSESLLSLETILPRYKLYPISDPVSVRILPGHLGRPTSKKTSVSPQLGSTAHRNVVCAIPRTLGSGFARDQKWRYVPLLETIDQQRQLRGACGWLLLNRAEPFAGSIFAGLGFTESVSFNSPDLLTFTTDLIRRLQQGVLLAEAGTEHFAYWPDEPIKLGLTVQNVSHLPRPATFQMTVCDQHGDTVWQVTQSLEVAARQQTSWQETVTLPESHPGTYRVSAKLIQDGRTLDRIDHELHVLNQGSSEKRDFITVQGNHFLLRGQPWHPVGINFWPLYVSGMDPADFWAGWLTRPYYDPQLVEQDLRRMKSLGINLVSVQSREPQHYRNLLDFLQRCSRHEIYVNLFCDLASPLAFQEGELRKFIETARLAENPTIMAYDTIWEPGNYVFRGDRRGRWDAAWRAWIVEQYGSQQAAETDWEFAGRRDADGRMISPPDKFFREDGPWRTMMAAYRRFMDDLTSHKWGSAHRRLRNIDPNHLISFRQGNTLPHDFVFTGTPKHIDFMCPEGYSIADSQDGYDTAGFITRYVHFTTRGKPIIWSEFGKSVWNSETMQPSSRLVQTVSDYHRLFYQMALESGANGTVPWWWPGGYRVEERSDYGIVNPDGTTRPAAELIAEYGPQLQTPRVWPAPTTWFDLDRDAHAGGYWHLCFHEGRAAYRNAVATGKNLGIRTAGTGTTSATTPPLAVGNRPWTGHNPAKFLNAEFNRLMIQNAEGDWGEANDGTTMVVPANRPVQARVIVGNTQEAEWVAPRGEQQQYGDVVLRTTTASSIQASWPLPKSTPYLSDADFGQITLITHITKPATVELRMGVIGRHGFGEKRTFHLVPVTRSDGR